MSYASKKGSDYERQVAKLLCSLYPDIKFVNVGGAEKTRKVLQGDVAVIAKDKDNTMESMWRNIFIECKCQANPHIKGIVENAKKNAQLYGKYGFVCFIKKQRQGHHADNEVVIFSKRANELIFGKPHQEAYDIHEFEKLFY